MILNFKVWIGKKIWLYERVRVKNVRKIITAGIEPAHYLVGATQINH